MKFHDKHPYRCTKVVIEPATDVMYGVPMKQSFNVVDITI